jgi:hypothetical protein
MRRCSSSTYLSVFPSELFEDEGSRNYATAVLRVTDLAV